MRNAVTICPSVGTVTSYYGGLKVVTLNEHILGHKRVRRALSRLKNSELDLDALRKECMLMHSQRAVRALRTDKLLTHSARILIDATTKDMTFRSRATEIKMKVLYEMLLRDEILSGLRKYILAQFGTILKKKFRTITEQKGFVDVLLESYTKQSRAMSNLIQITDLVITDIDQASWGLKHIQETLATLRQEKYG